eukprot:EG_transcript_32915
MAFASVLILLSTCLAATTTASFLNLGSRGQHQTAGETTGGEPGHQDVSSSQASGISDSQACPFLLNFDIYNHMDRFGFKLTEVTQSLKEKVVGLGTSEQIGAQNDADPKDS